MNTKHEQKLLLVLTCPQCKQNKVYCWNKQYNYAKEVLEIDHISCTSCDFRIYKSHIELEE